MELLLGSDKNRSWEAISISKIIKSIESCQTLKQVAMCKLLINNYIFASLLSSDPKNDQIIRITSTMLDLLIKTKQTQIMNELVTNFEPITK